MDKAVRKFKETIDLRSSFVRRLRSHRYFPIAVLALVLLIGAFFHIWQRVQVLESVRKIQILRHQNAALQDETKKLYSDVAELSMAGRIEQFAIDSLGMRFVEADQMYTLQRNRPAPDKPDDLAMMLSALKRVARYMPVVTENAARAGEVNGIKIDTAELNRGNR